MVSLIPEEQLAYPLVPTTRQIRPGIMLAIRLAVPIHQV
jgi:hypothetical protein